MQQTSLKNATLAKESGLCEHKNYSTSRMHCDVRAFYYASQSTFGPNAMSLANLKAYSHLLVDRECYEGHSQTNAMFLASFIAIRYIVAAGFRSTYTTYETSFSGLLVD